MQVMLGIRVRLDAGTRSNMLSCLVGSVTSRTRLKSLSMSVLKAVIHCPTCTVRFILTYYFQ